jgi:hypothetical protein
VNSPAAASRSAPSGINHPSRNGQVAGSPAPTLSAATEHRYHGEAGFEVLDSGALHVWPREERGHEQVVYGQRSGCGSRRSRGLRSRRRRRGRRPRGF